MLVMTMLGFIQINRLGSELRKRIRDGGHLRETSEQAMTVDISTIPILLLQYVQQAVHLSGVPCNVQPHQGTIH